MRDDPTIPCQLCGRGFTRTRLTQHHCLPKSQGGSVENIELICSQCHGMIHATFTNETLAALYPTIAQLRRAPELAGFLKWVRKISSDRHKKNKPRRFRM